LAIPEILKVRPNPIVWRRIIALFMSPYIRNKDHIRNLNHKSQRRTYCQE